MQPPCLDGGTQELDHFDLQICRFAGLLATGSYPGVVPAELTDSSPLEGVLDRVWSLPALAIVICDERRESRAQSIWSQSSILGALDEGWMVVG